MKHVETATKIEIIFDRDNGAENLGWYARATDVTGQERDIPFDARESAGTRTLVMKARRAVRQDGFHISRTCEVIVR